MSDHTAAVKLKYGAKPKTIKSYVTGLFLSLIFTVASFLVVSIHKLDTAEIYVAVTVLAIAQLFAQVICFLRLNYTGEGRWNTLAFLFTFLVVFVLIGGSLWIMYNLNMNMM